MTTGPSLLIMGRPNVGKSTLFNRFLGKKVALTDDMPGVTRDWQMYPCVFGDLSLCLYDLPGLEQDSDMVLMPAMWDQARRLIAQCDAVLLLFDAGAGLTPDDHVLADILRKTRIFVIVVANKAEKLPDTALLEGFNLGFGQPIAVSALHGQGMHDLLKALKNLPFSEKKADPDLSLDKPEPVVAVLGRPNVGKSTFINHCLQEDRLLTGPQAGITRDCIHVCLRWKGRTVRFIDTAGLRKKAHIGDFLEKEARAESHHALMFSQVCLLLLDATRGLEKQDLTILNSIEKEGRGLVIGLNKWDQVKNSKALLKAIRHCMDTQCAKQRGAPLVPISSQTGFGMGALSRQLFAVYDRWGLHLGTRCLNQWLQGRLSAHPPPLIKGRMVKLKYICQIKTRPPTFAIFGNQLDTLGDAYERYLHNALVEDFHLQGACIRLVFRTSDNPYAS